MRGSLLEVLVENERQANRSCAFAGLWTAAIAGYAKLRDYRGAELKFLMVLGSALIQFCMSIPSERDPAAAVREVQG